MSRLGSIGKQDCPFCGWQGISNSPVGEREDGSIEGWYCPKCMGVISYNPAPLYPDKPKRKNDDAPNVLVTATVLGAITLLVIIISAAHRDLPPPALPVSSTTKLVSANGATCQPSGVYVRLGLCAAAIRLRLFSFFSWSNGD